MRDPNRSSRQSTGQPSGSTLTLSRTSPTASGSPEAAESPAGGGHAVRSDTLLQGRSYVSIVHNGETYQLRATKLGKLILTK